MSWKKLVEAGPELHTNKKTLFKDDSLQFSDNKLQPPHHLFEDSLNNLNVAFSTPVKSANPSIKKDEVLVSYSQLVEVLDLISQANHSKMRCNIEIEELERRLLKKGDVIQASTQTHEEQENFVFKRSKQF